MVNSLFDKGRRERLRDAMKKNELPKALKKPEPESAMDVATTRLFDRRPAEQGIPMRASPPPLPAPIAPAPRQPAWDPKKIEQSQVLAVDRSYNSLQVDQELFDAIKAGDIAKVMIAINHCANVNAKYPHVPTHRAGDCIMVPDISPLEYAKRKGNKEIVKLLERYRAKD